MAGRPKKDKPKLMAVPETFDKDDEFGITAMQASFVWHYTEGACGQTVAARNAGFEFPSSAANKMLNGTAFPKVTRAVRVRQDELAEKYAITPQKTGTMLWNIAETAFGAGHYNASVSAIKELNQLAGLSVNRSQNININANLTTMNKDEIKERLSKLLSVEVSDPSSKDL
tara:strand:- start:393 stop:905 length:513 start_codon:yes stop_codon:yes gene_type:complete